MTLSSMRFDLRGVIIMVEQSAGCGQVTGRDENIGGGGYGVVVIVMDVRAPRCQQNFCTGPCKGPPG